MDLSIKSLQVKAPCVVGFGKTVDCPTDMQVVVEHNVFVMPSMSVALHFCIAVYYVRNNYIFPPAFRNVLLFLEKFVKTVCVKVTFVNPHPSPYIIYKLLLSLSFLYCEFAKVYEILKNVRLHVHT